MKTPHHNDEAGLLSRDGWRILCAVALFACALAALALLPACSTVTPSPAPVPAVASWDGAEQTSGIVGLQAGGLFLVTPHLRDRANALMAEYGREFAPALSVDSGLARVAGSDLWTMTPEAMANFATMAQWRRMGRAKQ